MTTYDREIRERVRRQREQARRARWLNGELRHAIENAHLSGGNRAERMSYVLGVMSARADLDVEELCKLLADRAPVRPRPGPVVLDPIPTKGA